MENDELYDKPKTRKILGGIGNTKLHAILASGELKAVKIGKRTFCRRSDLDSYLASLPAYQSAQKEGV